MNGLRRLNNGEWNKPPVLTAARRILTDALRQEYGVCKLGKAADFLNGTSYSTSEINESGEFPIIRISNISDPHSRYLRTNENLRDKFWIQPGDLLVSWSASFKTIIWPGPEGFLNQHIFKVTEGEGYDRCYIRHVIEASFDEIQENVVGIGMMHLRRGDFLGHPIPEPPLDVQKAVGQLLDSIESGDRRHKFILPSFFAEPQRIVARIEALAAQIDEAKRLRQEAAEEAEAMVTSFHIHASGRRTRKVGDLLTLSEDAVPVEPASSYPQVGVRSFGVGLFSKGAVAGTETSYRRFNRLYAGAIVLSQVKGWEGAIAVCHPDLEGWYVSPEYRTFRCVPGEATSDYLGALVTTEWFWSRLGGATRGVGARRERTRPEQFLELELPMPDVHAQHDGERVFRHLHSAKHLQAETAAELDALLPAILDRAFKGEL